MLTLRARLLGGGGVASSSPSSATPAACLRVRAKVSVKYVSPCSSSFSRGLYTDMPNFKLPDHRKYNTLGIENGKFILALESLPIKGKI